MKSKRGFMTIYICLFFMGFLSVLMLFLSGTRQSAIQSSTAAVGRLWGQAVLAEYDLNLYRRYHLFGFYGYPEDVKGKLRYYGEETGVPWDVESCSLYEHSLRNTDVFREQILEAGLLSQSETCYQPEQQVIPVDGHQLQEGEYLFEQLPSEGCSRNFTLKGITDLLEKEKGIEALLETGTEIWMEFSYLFSHFKHKGDDGNLGESFFEQEIEYIVGGKTSDEENEKLVKRRILAIREVMNLLYLNKNPVTRNEALAVAEILTPGPAAAATQQAILSAWALVESKNDYKLLVNGRPVQMMKTEYSWAVGLNSVIENKEEDCIYTGVNEGDTYQNYLKLLLLAMDDSVRILRAMDLIQINFRLLYYRGFLLKEYNGGLTYTYNINGRRETIEMQYE